MFNQKCSCTRIITLYRLTVIYLYSHGTDDSLTKTVFTLSTVPKM